MDEIFAVTEANPGNYRQPKVIGYYSTKEKARAKLAELEELEPELFFIPQFEIVSYSVDV